MWPTHQKKVIWDKHRPTFEKNQEAETSRKSFKTFVDPLHRYDTPTIK